MIKTENLTKRFKTVTAVNDLNLNISEGVIFGFIGPNGAGKTTTIKMIGTLLEPTSGKCYINDICVQENYDKVKPLIGYMPDFFGVYDDMKVWEYLEFFAAAYKIPKSKRTSVVDDVLELTDLHNKRKDFVDNLSRGMKQRLCLAKTLVHDPKILLLDEPASGLDPRARIEMRELLRELKKMGKTILISSHILTELEDIVDEIGIIEKGELLYSGNVANVREQIRTGSNFIIKIEVLNEIERAKELLENCQNVHSVELTNKHLKVEFSGTKEEIAELIEFLITNKIKLLSFQEEETDLEDVFMKITRGLVA